MKGNSKPAQPEKSVVGGRLYTQFLTLADLTLRNGKDTEAQREALELKELLERWKRDKSQALPVAA